MANSSNFALLVARRREIPLLLAICLFCSAAIAAPASGSRQSAKYKTAAAQKKTTATATKKAISSRTVRPKVIELSAVWCGPCHRFAPTFEKVKKAYMSKVDFESLDIDKPNGKAVASRYHIDAVPAIIILDSGGKISYQNEGIIDEPTLTTEVLKATH
jgi:thioredoxin-like negative regulator of GroEL